MSVTICLALEERFCIRFAWQGFFWGGRKGGYRHSFFEKQLIVSDRANARWAHHWQRLFKMGARGRENCRSANGERSEKM